MTFWAKSLRVFNCLWENGTQSVRRIAHKTGFSKSSVHRLQQAIARRGCHPESWLWETEDGRCWLIRLVVATLYTFGLKRGVGLETISEFFVRLRLATQVGCSPSALRGVMQALEAALLETAAAWEQDGCASGEMREIIGAVDETFLERMILVLMDLATGYLLLEEVADDRTYPTWKALVEERLKALGTGVLYVVSDRAKALIQLAEQGLECLSMPDFFHVAHEIVKSYALAIGQRWRHAQQELTKAKEALARRQGLLQGRASDPRGESAGGSAASRGDALGRGIPHLSGPRGEPLAHAASLPYLGLDAPDLRPGRRPTHGDGGGDRSVRTVPAVAGAA